jgi:hypothetical protein
MSRPQSVCGALDATSSHVALYDCTLFGGNGIAGASTGTR